MQKIYIYIYIQRERERENFPIIQKMSYRLNEKKNVDINDMNHNVKKNKKIVCK